MPVTVSGGYRPHCSDLLQNEPSEESSDTDRGGWAMVWGESEQLNSGLGRTHP